MKTVIITITIMIALIVGVKYFSADKNFGEVNNSSSGSKISIEQNNIDIGEIPIEGGKVDTVFLFRNDGDDPITIVKGATSCMCTEAVVKKSDGKKSPRLKMAGHGSIGLINMVMEPGEEMELIATFDPMAHGPNALGSITRDVTIETNSKTTPELRFSFQGNVVR